MSIEQLFELMDTELWLDRNRRTAPPPPPQKADLAVWRDRDQKCYFLCAATTYALDQAKPFLDKIAEECAEIVGKPVHPQLMSITSLAAAQPHKQPILWIGTRQQPQPPSALAEICALVLAPPLGEIATNPHSQQRLRQQLRELYGHIKMAL